MAITTYAQLQTAIQAWSERTDLASYVTDFITLTESRIKKSFGKVRLRPMETIDDLTPAAGICTLPTDFLAMKTVRALTSPTRRLEYATEDWMEEAYPSTEAGVPGFYTVVGSSLTMKPATSSDIRITYWATPPALSDAATTNWLLTAHPEIYLYGGLLELETFAENDEGIAKWGTLFVGAVQSLEGMEVSDAITSGTARRATSQTP